MSKLTACTIDLYICLDLQKDGFDLTQFFVCSNAGGELVTIVGIQPCVTLNDLN
jgi:hypothetical protein